MASAEKVAARLRSPSEISAANETLFDDFRKGKIDPKTVDGCNTLLKAQVYLNVKLPMDYLKIYTQAKIKAINLPKGLLPDLDALANSGDEDKGKK